MNKPLVGLCPNIPQKLEGMRIDPPISVPAKNELSIVLFIFKNLNRKVKNTDAEWRASR